MPVNAFSESRRSPDATPAVPCGEALSETDRARHAVDHRHRDPAGHLIGEPCKRAAGEDHHVRPILVDRPVAKLDQRQLELN